MSEETKLTEAEFTKKAAINAFNFVWELLDKADRTIEENDQMIHAAHTSRYLWSKVGTAVNLVRGEWQISRVYSVLNQPSSAIYHAERCLQICQAHQIGDFDLAYAYEALWRAYHIVGNTSEAAHYFDLAKAAGETIAEEEDKTLFLSDLDKVY